MSEKFLTQSPAAAPPQFYDEVAPVDAPLHDEDQLFTRTPS